MMIMNNFEENLRDAILDNDIGFLEKHKGQYDIDHRLADYDNDTLLLYAVHFGDSEAYKFFLENGADITLVNGLGEGILHAIVFSDVPERLSYFMTKYHLDINARATNGMTPLGLSTFIGKFEMTKFLITAGADVNVVDNEYYSTPLHDAVWADNLEIVRLLVAKGANLHIKDKNGHYPLALAVSADHENVAKYLYERMYLQKD